MLALNHKQAAQYLWANRDLTVANVCCLHALLTNNHNVEDVSESEHFLGDHQRGKPREYEEVNLGASAYIPPFRPGTGFVARMLDKIVATANELHPVSAAVYQFLHAKLRGSARRWIVPTGKPVALSLANTVI